MLGENTEFDDLTSLDRVCIAAEIEEAFLVEVPDSMAERWETVADVLRSVREMGGVCG